MSFRTRMALVMLWVTSLAVVATLARAQVLRSERLPAPQVISGNDVGFRIEARQGGIPVGKKVVRQNGQWVEVRFNSAPSIQPAGNSR